MNNLPFSDMPDDLDFGAVAPARPMSEIAKQRFVAPPSDGSYSEACKKCNGSGQFRSYYGRALGACFACKGAGKLVFKSSPEQRAKARARADERKEAERLQRVAEQQAWAAEHKDVLGWIQRAESRMNEFAISLSNSIAQYGSLTEGQVAAVRRCIERDAERAAAKAAAPKPEPKMLSALHDVMQRHAKFYAGDLTLSRRREDQLVWIKHANAEKVIGKIDGGELSLWNRPGVDMEQVKSMLEEFEGAPLQAAMKYGKLSGRCCSCGRELTNDGSIEAGIGPICAAKF